MRRWLQNRTPAGWRRSEIPDWPSTSLRPGAGVLLFVVLALARPASAADKVDVITFKNGDRLTCEIKTLERGTLEISTDPLGTVNVHWGEVTELESPRLFEVQVSSGYQYFGLLRAAPPGRLVVVDGGTEVTLDLFDIIRLNAIGSTIWNRVDGSVDSGFSFAQANLETHWTANAAATYRGRKYTSSANYGSNITTREDADRTFRSDLSLTGARLLNDRWYLLAWSGVEQNDELSLDLRLLGAGGFGRDIVHTNHRLWSLFSGLSYTHEQFAGEPADQSLEAAAGIQFDFFTPMNDDFDISNRLVSYYRLTGGGRVRLDFQSAYRHELFKDFYWSLNVFDTFDGDPPEGEKRNDFGVSITLGYKF